jgi:hypothetical protein
LHVIIPNGNSAGILAENIPCKSVDIGAGMFTWLVDEA